MQLISSEFALNGEIPAKYTCQGDNSNPPLEWTDVPDDTQSFALIMDDPDAPNGDWVHWIMWNIHPETRGVEENSVPTGAIQGTNSGGIAGYHGPCPPSGVHHYHFKLYALNVESLDLDETASKEELEQAIEGKTTDMAELVGTYEKA